jgi:hypothetical protein
MCRVVEGCKPLESNHRAVHISKAARTAITFVSSAAQAITGVMPSAWCPVAKLVAVVKVAVVKQHCQAGLSSVNSCQATC